MREEGKKALIDVVIMSIITSLLYIGSAYMPILDLFIFLGAYLPIIYICSKHSVFNGILSVISISIILFITVGTFYTLSFLFTNAIIGLTLGYYTKKKQDGFVVVGVLLIVLLLSIGLFMKVVGLLTGVDVLSQSIDSVVNSVNESTQVLKSMGIGESNIFNQLSISELRSYLELTMPGMALIMMTILSYIYYMIAQKSLKRFNVHLEPLREFSKWYIPTKIAYPVLILFLISIFIKSEDLSYIVYTIRVIFYLVFIINALATISYYLNLKKFPKPLIGVVLFAIFMFLPNILVFVGLLEYVFNIRALDKKRISIRRK